MDKVYLCALVFGLFSSVLSSINITELSVPDAIKLGTVDEIILDCNFVADESEEGLELKWFYNNSDEAMYEWIPETGKRGAARGFLKDRLDLTFNITDDDDTRYRALRIRNVSPDLSGNYTCTVGNQDNEATKTKQLVIYSPPESGIDIILFKNEALVICTANGVLPVPEMDFYIQTQNGSRVDVAENVEILVDNEGYCNVTARHHYDNITLQDLTIFVCNLSIPGTSFVLTKTLELQNEYSYTEEDYISLLYSDDNTTEVDNFNRTEDFSGVIHLSSSYFSLLLLLLGLILNQ